MPETVKRCIKCGRIIAEEELICLSCGSENEMQTFRPRIITNGDKLRNMPDDELLKAIGLSCRHCIYFSAKHECCGEPGGSCTDGNMKWLKKWLKKEVDNGTSG